MKQIRNFVDHIGALGRCGTQIIQIVTTDRARCLKDLRLACMTTLSMPDEPLWRLVSWGFHSGFSDADPGKKKPRLEGNPVAAMDALPTSRFAVTDPVTVQAETPSRVSGLVTDITQLGDTVVVTVGDRPHALDPLCGPRVALGQSVRVGDNLARPYSPNLVAVFCDMADMFHDILVRATLKDLYENQQISSKTTQRMLVLMGAVPVRHPEIDYAIVNVVYDLPTLAQLEEVVDHTAAMLCDLDGKPDPASKVTLDFRRALAGAMTGFSQSEALDTLAYLSYVCDGFSHVPTLKEKKEKTEAELAKKQEEHEEVMLRELYRRQRDAWANEDILELYNLEDVEGFDMLAGWENVKEWAERVRFCLSNRARELDVPPPKGAIIGGTPGTGKSYSALILAKTLRLPLIKFRFEAVFGSLVGASESQMRQSLAKIKAKGPCVVLLDEVDKAMGGIANSAGGDSGVGMRVLGQFLSWQANENKDALVLATLNHIRNLPPELMRAGRFDVIWYTDIPSPGEQADILTIHLQKRGIDPSFLNAAHMATLLDRMRGFVGAEIEQCVKIARMEAMFRSQGAHANPDFALLLEVAGKMTPTVELDRSGIEAIQKAFEGKARPVSKERTGVLKGQRAVRISRRDDSQSN